MCVYIYIYIYVYPQDFWAKAQRLSAAGIDDCLKRLYVRYYNDYSNHLGTCNY